MAEIQDQIWSEVQRAIYDAVKHRLSNEYSSPLTKLVDGVVENHTPELKALLDKLFTEAIRSDSFQKAASEQIAHKVAKCLMSKMEGAVEKATNTLRSDPTTRAKILLAIETIVAEHQPVVSPAWPPPRATVEQDR